MRIVSVLLMCLALAGCHKTVAADVDHAACFAASELALMKHTQASPSPDKPRPSPQPVVSSCKCNGTRYVNDRSTGTLRRIACPCGSACKCIGLAPAAVEKPEVIFWTKRGCAPCKAVLAELEACKDELEFKLLVKDDTHKQPDWLPSWPTLHWCIDHEFNEWRSFSPSKESPWPGVDEFARMWRKSFPQRAATTPVATVKASPLGLGVGSIPIRATVQQLKQLLSNKGLSLPYGMKVNAPTHGLIASLSQSGENVLIEFDDSTLPQVSFNGKVRRALIGEARGSIVIDGLPDVSFVVTP